MRTAPVSVATSMMASGWSSTARLSPSARTRRPSASVLSTSIVVPFLAVSTSPGRIARFPGRFSVSGAIAVTFAAAPSRAATLRAPRTIAAPVMSVFIVAIPSAVFRLSPPESNVMPLPTSTTWDVAPGGL